MKFPESALAHKYLDGLDGIEIGGSAHNPFGIAGCRNVDYCSPVDPMYAAEQERLCGEVLAVDVVDDGETLATFADSSLDYILSSHVFEHFPNPLAALLSWARVLKDGGIIYMVVPLRDALPQDANRELTTWEHVLEDFVSAHTAETHGLPEGHGVRGHYHVYSLESLRGIIEEFSAYLKRCWQGTWFEVVDSLAKDDKVGNGHTLVLRAHKPCTSSPA